MIVTSNILVLLKWMSDKINYTQVSSTVPLSKDIDEACYAEAAIGQFVIIRFQHPLHGACMHA